MAWNSIMIHLKELKKYGFRLEPEKHYWFKKINGGEIFIWKASNDEFIKNGIYIESEYISIIYELDVIYELIKDGLVEEVGE